MEVKTQQSHLSASEPGTMSGRESFGVGVQKNQVSMQAPANMRLAFSPDGTAVYAPITTTSPSYPGSGGGGGGGGGVDGQTATIIQHSINTNSGEPMKRKRGRPRKYGPDGAMALALTPVSPPSTVPPSGGGVGSGSGGFSLARSPSSPSKKGRGRPLGSGKKQQMAALGNSLLLVILALQFFSSLCAIGFWFCFDASLLCSVVVFHYIFLSHDGPSVKKLGDFDLHGT